MYLKFTSKTELASIRVVSSRIIGADLLDYLQEKNFLYKIYLHEFILVMVPQRDSTN